MRDTDLLLAVALAWCGLLAGLLLGLAVQPDCPDTTEQAEALDLEWAQEAAQLRGRAFRAEQETADAMVETARLRDMLRWSQANHVLVERGTAEWAAVMRAKGLVTNAVLAVEQGAVIR